MTTKNLIERLVETAQQYPDNNALYVDGKFYTYKQLLDFSNAIKKKIKNSEYKNEKIIGVVTGSDIYTYASIIAIIAHGSAYLPINKNNPVDRTQNIVSQTNLKLILSSGHYDEIDQLSKFNEGKVKVLNTYEVQAKEGEFQFINREADDLLYLFFTSGTTGVPKGVPIYNRNLNQFFSATLDSELYKFSSEDKFLQMFELTFDLSVMSYFTPLCIGACCYVVPESGISYLNIATMLEEQKITVALMVPSVLMYLEKYFDELKYPELRHSIFCGEPLPYHLVRGWRNCVPNASIQNAYGPTEATIYCLSYDYTSATSDEVCQGNLPIGKPFPGMKVLVWSNDEEKNSTS